MNGPHVPTVESPTLAEAPTPRQTTFRFGARSAPASGRALVMAIVNRTPDSFYDRGATYELDTALAAADAAVRDGADIVDVGGVKAGPGVSVDEAEEIRRVVPFVAELRQRHPDVVISVDTWRSGVAVQACAAGADLINDSWAGADPQLVDVAADLRVGLVCSHTGGLVPRTRPHRTRYADPVSQVVDELRERACDAVERGVPEHGILIDPTHDFGKNTWHGLALVRGTPALVATGWPVLMSFSRKDFIGETLNVAPADRLEGTLATTTMAATSGARVFRVHDVVATRRTLEMVASVLGTRAPARAVRGLA